MIKKITMLFIAFAFVTGSLFAQTVSGSWVGCNNLEISTSGTQPFSLFQQIQPATCSPGDNLGIAGAPVDKFRFDLQRSNPNSSTWTTVETVLTNSTSQIFEDLATGFNYRCLVGHRLHANRIAVSISNPCGGSMGRIFSGTSNVLSGTFEAGHPRVWPNLRDHSGTHDNGVFCLNYGDIGLRTKAWGETRYYLYMKKVGTNQQIGGWHDGKVPWYIDLYEEWPWYLGEGTYNVRIAVAKDYCTGWEEGPQFTFTIVSGDCRIGTFEAENDINLYPNPASSVLTVDNLNTNAEEMEYEIFGTTGQLVNTGTISNKNQINIQGLDNGTYYIKLVIDEEVITKKFVVLKE